MSYDSQFILYVFFLLLVFHSIVNIPQPLTKRKHTKTSKNNEKRKNSEPDQSKKKMCIKEEHSQLRWLSHFRQSTKKNSQAVRQSVSQTDGQIYFTPIRPISNVAHVCRFFLYEDVLVGFAWCICIKASSYAQNSLKPHLMPYVFCCRHKSGPMVLCSIVWHKDTGYLFSRLIPQRGYQRLSDTLLTTTMLEPKSCLNTRKLKELTGICSYASSGGSQKYTVENIFWN